MFKRYQLKNYDFKLILLLVMISAVGILAVGSADESQQQRQLAGVALGMGVMVVISLIDYSQILRLYWAYYVLSIGMLAAVLIWGEEVNGAMRWINIPHLFQFQPSEITKILLILFYAQFIIKHRERLNTFRVLSLCVLLMLPAVVLLYMEPNLSTTILYCVLFCVLMFVGGLSYKIIGAVLAVAVPSLALLLYLVMQPGQTLIRGYQLTRILAWLNPEQYADTQAYQQLNSVMAIGSGQLWGKGLNNNVIASVKNGNFIPEPETDFIFAVIGEELGFVGSCAVIVLLFLIALECISVARQAKDLSGTIIASGMAAIIGFQSFMNIAVTTMLMPNTGIPLPFVSSGLTSLVSLFIGMGFVLNVRLQRNDGTADRRSDQPERAQIPGRPSGRGAADRGPDRT